MDLRLLNRQNVSLSPQMIQSGKVLQMGAQELLEYITEVIQENPVLEFPENRDWEPEFDRIRRKMEWMDSSDRQERYYRRQDGEFTPDPLANCQAPQDQGESLRAHLMAQLQGRKLPEKLRRAARGIVENLNDCGYLDEPLENLAGLLRMDREILARGLKLVQSLEPAGVGAESLEECLLLQLERQDGEELAKKIVSGHLDALAKNRYAQIAKALGAEPQEVRKACAQIRRLNPKPGSGFSDCRDPRYITPDLLVRIFPDRLELIANDRFFPDIQISAYYRDLMYKTQDEDVKEYLTEKVQQAKWVIRSIQQRRSTLIRCAECILQLQEAFFRRGEGHLVPMRLGDVARILEVHESTVSRAVRNKYIQCVHGIYPMSCFFSRGLGGEEDREEVSADGAKALLKKLIREEDKEKPASDQKLCGLMAEQGYPLSRRTVAKYREELGIPAAAVRKEV